MVQRESLLLLGTIYFNFFENENFKQKIVKTGKDTEADT